MYHANFEKHLHRLQSTVYPESISVQHSHITKTAIKAFVEPKKQEIKNVLDVGCGQGPALEEFNILGLEAIGITLDDGDLNICREKGYLVEKQDMNFLTFQDESFDLVWARHCLEHSPMPMITLLEFERVVTPGGYVYIEVPQDDSVHVDNLNHYSMLSDRAWQSLIRRTKLKLLYRGQWTIQLDTWTDIYWYYWLQKG